MAVSLSPRPDLKQIKRQAKELLGTHQNADTSSCARLRLIPRLADLTDEQIMAADIGLQEAQHALAKDYGFATWAELKTHIAANTNLDQQMSFMPEVGQSYTAEDRRTAIRETLQVADLFEGTELGAKALMTGAKLYSGWCMEVCQLGDDGWDRAIQLYNRVIDEYPGSESAVQARWWLASCYGAWPWAYCCEDNQGKRDWHKASEAYMALYESATDPGSRCDALRRYAEIQFHCQGKWQEGLGTYRRLLEEFPEDPKPSPYRTCRTCGWGPFSGTNLIDYNLMLASGPAGANTHAGLMWRAATAADAIRLHEEFVSLAPQLDTIRYHGLYHLEQKLRHLGETQRADRVKEELGLCDDWLVVGPFHNGNGSKPGAFEPETDLLEGGIDLAKTYAASTRDGRKGTAMWAESNSIIGADLFGTHPEYHFITAVGTFYALTDIHSSKAQATQLRVGASGQVSAWIQGLIVPTGEVSEMPSTLVDMNVWPIELSPGENRLLMRFDLVDNYGTGENYVRITSSNGQALSGISFSTPGVPESNRSHSTFMKGEKNETR